MFRIALCAAMLSAPAFAAHAIQFNGYSVTVDATRADFDEADKIAAQLCESVGKSAERQVRRKMPASRYSIFYVCL